MKLNHFKESTIDHIKVFTVSGIIVVTFYEILNNFKFIGQAIQFVMSALSPFIFGFAFAFLLNPFRKLVQNEWLKHTSFKMKTKKIIAAFCALFLLIILLLLFIAILVPQLMSSFQTFINSLQSYMNYARTLLANYNIETTEIYAKINEMIPKITEWLTSDQGGIKIFMLSASFAKGVLNFLIGIIIALYMMLDEVNLKRQMKKLLYAFFKKQHADSMIEIGRLTVDTFNGFIAGKALDSLIIGIICYISLFVMKMPYAPLIAFVVGVTNMIPVFGPFIGAIPSIVILLIIDPFKAIEFAIFILVLQQVDGNIIGPYILGDAVGLPTIWVMFAIIVGGALFGIVGMFLGVPLFSVFYVLLKRWIHLQLDQKQIQIDEKNDGS